jgi:integrase
MGRTRTSGITTDADGNKLINKQVNGQTIFARLGRVSQEEAEAALAARIAELRQQQPGEGDEPTFAAAAKRYLADAQEEGLKTLETEAWHVTLLAPFIGALPLSQVCDETLAAFKRHRREVDKVSATTVKRHLEVVRKVLNRAHHKWRLPPDYQKPWLQVVPDITMPRLTDARQPRPLSWEEQATLMPLLPAHLQRMVLFALNTGLRDSEVCGLRWEWEVKVPELETFVFLIPGTKVKNGEPRVVVLNHIARRIVEEVRGEHPDYVFVYAPKRNEKKMQRRGQQAKPPHPIETINNNGWQRARRKAGSEKSASTISATRSPEGFGRQAYLLGHGRRCSATRTETSRSTTRRPSWVSCWPRSTRSM